MTARFIIQQVGEVSGYWNIGLAFVPPADTPRRDFNINNLDQ